MRTLPFLAALASAAVLAACGGDDSGGNPVDAKLPDSGIPIDAAADAPSAPATLTLSGTTKEITAGGQTVQSGVTVTAYKVSDDSMIGMATSDASGNFSITVQTGGVAVNGYVKANKGTMYLDTYLYPPGVLTADLANVPVFLLTPGTFSAAGLLLGSGQDASTGKGFIGVLAEDATGAPVAGVAISTTPAAGSYGYNSPSNHLPSGSATSTDVDGIGYACNVTPGQALVAATKTGLTFHSHSVKARPNVVTLTIVAE